MARVAQAFIGTEVLKRIPPEKKATKTMSAIYTRVRGADLEVQKIPVWPVITSMGQLLDNEITDAEFVARFSLSPAEQAEFAQIKTKVTGDLAAMIADFQAAGISETNAGRLARDTIRITYEQPLLRAELGYIDAATFNAAMGIS